LNIPINGLSARTTQDNPKRYPSEISIDCGQGNEVHGPTV
jgi:hypothetical protein